MKISVLDARFQFLPGEGWVFVVTWQRADGRGHVVEEIHAQ